MQSLKSSFLLIGPWPPQFTEWGAEIVADLASARSVVKNRAFHVIGLSITSVLEKKFTEFFEHIKSENPATQILAVVPSDFSSASLIELHNQYQFFKVISSYQDPEVEALLYSALEESHQRQQDENLAMLMQEQKQKLVQLQSELEKRVEKRTKFLTESRRKLFVTNHRIEGFKESLMAVHQATSVSDIERLLSEKLAPSVDTSWIRIFFSPQDEVFKLQVQEQLNFTQLQLPLYNNNKQMGSIFFMRAPNRPFLKEESDFLARVAEAVSLALDRIQKLQEIETVKEHWENTFNALSEPLLLIDSQYEIVQTNQVARELFAEPLDPLVSQKCYQALFGRNKPCEDCRRGQSFRTQHQMDGTAKTFDVFSQELSLDSHSPAVFVNLYNDITDKIRMENQLLESARLAELGTIGSSIAHELNNPLGGILTFSQLIKMEMPKDHPLYADIAEIEKGAQRCKEIIQNLLGFSRAPSADQISDLSVKEVVQRALKILELQTKSIGIDIRVVEEPQEDYKIQGHLNLLSQALKNILQLALDLLINEQRQKSNFRGQLEIKLKTEAQEIRVEVRNFLPFNKNSLSGAGLALPIAQQIFHDQKAEVEVHADSTGNWTAKISFSRPVLGP